MRQVRRGVFETNSSSTHSLTICTEEEFENWKRGEFILDRYGKCFIRKTSIIDFNEEESKNHYISTHPKSCYYKSWEELSDDEIKKWHTYYLTMQSSKINNSYDYQTYDDWYNDYDLEKFDYKYTTPSGDKIVVFGKYGYN